MYDNTNTTTPALPFGFMIDADGMIAEDPSQTGNPPVTTSLPSNYQPRKSDSYQSAYSRAMDNFSAADLDRKCDEMHEANLRWLATR